MSLINDPFGGSTHTGTAIQAMQEQANHQLRNTLFSNGLGAQTAGVSSTMLGSAYPYSRDVVNIKITTVANGRIVEMRGTEYVCAEGESLIAIIAQALTEAKLGE